MATRKASVKRKALRDLKRATTPVEAQEIIEELKADIDPRAESFEGRKPGVIVGGTKVGYTYPGLCEQFPIVTFTPEETIKLTFQGITVQAIAGMEMHVPQCFKELYDNHRKALRNVGGALPNLGFYNLVELGIGALPPE